MKKVNEKYTAINEADEARPGRVAQRNRTRRLIIETAMRLIEQGATPSMAEIAEAAEVSRRTVYMYFPTQEQLLIDATLGVLSGKTIDAVITDSASNDPVERVEQLSRAMNEHCAETMHLGRALIRLTVEGDAPSAGGPRRGYRRVQWIEKALAPAREKLTPKDFERLVSALSVLVGWEPMIALRDTRGLEQKEADEVLVFAVRAVVEKALAEAQARRKRK
jgi:AcrR family transcriptional regulator